MNSPIILLATPSMMAMAQKIVRMYGNFFTIGTVNFNTYPDKTPNITFDAKILMNKHVVFLGSLFEKSLFLDQMSMVTILRTMKVDIS